VEVIVTFQMWLKRIWSYYLYH